MASGVRLLVGSAAVITSVHIDALRGVREGLVDGLSPLSIFVGPNNAGKSTCLEAIAAVALDGQVAEIVRILLRRGGPPHDALEHVITEGATAALVQAQGADDRGPLEWTTKISIHSTSLSTKNREEMGLDGFDGSLAKVVSLNGRASVNVDQRGRRFAPFQRSPRIPLKLVDVEAVRAVGALEDAYSRLERAGQVDKVVRALQRSMPDLIDLRILKSGPDFILHAMCSKGHPVPTYVTGDGFKRFIEVASAALDKDSGIVLLEEPEAYQHPRYLRELGDLLLQAAQDGTQVILSTHSIELMDILLHAPEAQGLPYPTVHRLRLVDGRLSSVGLDRERALTARDELLEDLRS